jgi:DNA-binding beta-propeller fold protein YncE
VHLQTVPGEPFSVVARGPWAFAGLTSTVGVLHANAAGQWSLVRTLPGLPGGQSVEALGEALTPDGRYLLVAGNHGALVISVARAESGAAHPVLGTLSDPYASGGIEVTVSRDGRYAFVSMENSQAIAVFRLHQALTSGFGSGDLAGQIPTGLAPVGLALTSNGSRLIVADSNRFLTPGRSASLAVIDTAAALAGRPALLGYLPAGRFPRDISVASGGQLLVANFMSGQLETVQDADLP